MSAATMLLKPDAVHLLVDAAIYQPIGPEIGIVGWFRDKCVVIPEPHCAMTLLGPALGQDLLAEELQKHFTSFDEIVEGAEPVLRRMHASWDARVSTNRTSANVWFAGWSKKRERAEGYAVNLATAEEFEKLKANAPNKNASVAEAPFRLTRCVGLMANPLPTSRDLIDAGIQPTDDITTMPVADLLRVIEAQRRIKVTGGGPYFYGIGGYALLTSVDRHGITQRKIHTWEEDQVGELITPRPLDLKQWRAEHDGIESAAPIELSRVRREMLARRERKAARRAA